MPSCGTQMYWHDAPAPLPPWLSEDQRLANVRLARVLKDERISPTSGNTFLVGNRPVELAKERMRLKNARRMLLNVGKGRLKVEPLLSHRCVLNMLLNSLGAEPLSHDECVELVRNVRSKLLQSDFPMVACVQAVARIRGLDARSLSREELKHRRCTFFPSDLAPGKRTLLICSKIEPLFVGVYTEWLPSGRALGRAAMRGVNGAMRVLCPAHQPQPWHKRVQVLRQIDRNETLCVYLARPEDARAWDDEQQAARTARMKKGRSNPKNDAVGSGAVENSVSGVGRTDDAGSTTVSTEVSSSDSESEDNTDEASSTDWSDLDVDALELSGRQLIGPSSMAAGGALQIAASRSGGDNAVVGDSVPLGGSANSSSGRARLSMLASVQLEANASVTDPFAMLPSADKVVAASVLDSLKNVQSRSSATWTQRLLRQKDRKTLYNFAHSQMSMME